jgi:hypothetical protein
VRLAGVVGWENSTLIERMPISAVAITFDTSVSPPQTVPPPGSTGP